MSGDGAAPTQPPDRYPAMRPVQGGPAPTGRRWRTVAVAVTVAVAAGAGIGAAGWSWAAADGRRCESSRAQLQLLQAEPILAAAPPDAVPEGHYATPGCQDEDGIGAAGRSYRYRGDRDELISFYRARLRQQGWTVLPGPSAPGAVGLLCARRAVGAEPASALIAPDRTDPAAYAVEVSSGNGGGWCS